MNSSHQLGLGTVQWGMQYGVTNVVGKSPAEEVRKILHAAKMTGVDLLDTALAYGAAQDVICQIFPADAGFRMVTKTPPLKGLGTTITNAALSIENAFKYSLVKLQGKIVYGPLVYHGHDLLGSNGPMPCGVLEKFKAEGALQKIGCCLSQPDKNFTLRQRYALDPIQVGNIYEQRYEVSGAADMAKSKGIEAHARRAFLQGILLYSPTGVPIHNADLQCQHIALWRELQAADMTAVDSPSDVCLACPHVDRVLVGCAEINRLEQVISVAGSFPRRHHFEQCAPFAMVDESHN